jgi:anti-anti-sigma factor
MRITAEEYQATGLTVQVVKVDGYLDAHTFPDLEKHLRGFIDSGRYHIILDFETLDYISSAGLGLLLGIHRLISQRDGRLKIYNMSESLQRVFEVLGFARIIEVCPDREAALRALEN